MDIKILNKTNNEVVFVLDNSNHIVANTLRRLINSEVCTLAIENVSVIKNSSAIYDEMLAHRLGLIPLKTDLKSYTKFDECKCKGKGCAHCQVVFSLKVKGPCTAYASDLVSNDKKIVPVYPNIPIVKLLKDQELSIEATAILSNGKDHTKFSPGLAYYFGYPEGASDSEVVKLEASKIEKCSDKKFVFNLESWGQLSAREILSEAINILDAKLDEFGKLIKKLK